MLAYGKLTYTLTHTSTEPSHCQRTFPSPHQFSVLQGRLGQGHGKKKPLLLIKNPCEKHLGHVIAIICNFYE